MTSRFQVSNRGFYWRIWGRELGNRVWMNVAVTRVSEKIAFGFEYKDVTYCWKQLTFNLIFFHVSLGVCWDPAMSRDFARLHDPSLPNDSPRLCQLE